MSNLSTKDIKASGTGGQPKTLEPGNQQLKINGIELEEYKFKAGAYHVLMHMEGVDLGPTFTGFFINKDNETLGRHKGAVGRVKASEWAYADGRTKGGIDILKDQEILKFIKTLCTALGKDALKWLDNEDGKHPTIESIISAFNTAQPFKDKFLNYCVGGKEYKDKKGYTKYDLFLPKFSKSGIPFEIIEAKPSKLVIYNETDHLRKAKVNEVTEFGNESTLSRDANKDFTL